MNLSQLASLAEIGMFILMVILALPKSKSGDRRMSLRTFLIFIIAIVGIASASLVLYSTRHTPITEVAAFDEWSKIPVVAIEGKKFTHEKVIVDGNSYRKCTFDQVTLIYNGTAPFDMIECYVSDGVRLTSSKPEIAGFLHALYGLKLFKPEVTHDIK